MLLLYVILSLLRLESGAIEQGVVRFAPAAIVFIGPSAVGLMSAVQGFLRLNGASVSTALYFVPVIIFLIQIAPKFTDPEIRRSRGMLLAFGGVCLALVAILLLEISVLFFGQSFGAGQIVLTVIIIGAFVIASAVGPLVWLLEWSGAETRRAVDLYRSAHQRH